MAEPLPWCLLGGELSPLAQAHISPLDRSFLFGDGIYEVMPVYGSKPFRPELHWQRLERSAAAIDLPNPHSDREWDALVQRLIEANGGGDLYIYLHLSRGAEWGRNHAPSSDVRPLVFAYASPWPVATPEVLTQGLFCVTSEDNRWGRCDIKSVALLANVLLRQKAAKLGASEAILLKNGWLREGSASTVLVVQNSVVLAPPNSTALLPGTTRQVLEEILDELRIARRAVEISETTLRSADEIWLAAATREVQAVTRLDEARVGSGKPGEIWQRVYERFQELKRH
jgi:D-alanine transaminase